MAKSRERIILVVIRRGGKGSQEELMPCHIDGSIRDGIRELQGMLDEGHKIVRYYDLGSNYFTDHIVALGHLGDGDARASALGELENLISVIKPAIISLKN